MAIISVSGKINSGKDTVGKIIQYLCSRENATFQSWSIAQNNCKSDIVNKFYQGGWEIVKWADKLKDMVCILLSCTREQLEDRVFKETELSEEWWYYKIQTFSNINPFRIYSYLEHTNKLDNSTLIKPTPRLLMQLLGTECGRNIIHPNVWVNATLSDYRPYGYEKGSNKNVADVLEDIHFNTLNYLDWIITDTRFPNEADAVKSRDGINIRLNRPNPKGIINDFENSDINLHPSETALDNYTFDYVIENNGTIEDLIIKVKEILIKENII